MVSVRVVSWGFSPVAFVYVSVGKARVYVLVLCFCCRRFKCVLSLNARVVSTLRVSRYYEGFGDLFPLCEWIPWFYCTTNYTRTCVIIARDD